MNQDRTHETGAASGAATAAAMAPFDEKLAKDALDAYGQRLSAFINRRISSEPNVTVVVAGRTGEALEYLPGGDGLGRLKVQYGTQDPVWVDCDETAFETLLAKIIHD